MKLRFVPCLLLTGQRVFQAHRHHLFQRLHQAGWPHARVSRLYIAAIRAAPDPLPTHPATTPAHTCAAAGLRTATQITALAFWLRERQSLPPRRLWIATDPEHTARATLLARIALAGRGIEIQPDPPPPPTPSERQKLVRDALRLVLWRATGSTGGWLV